MGTSAFVWARALRRLRGAALLAVLACSSQALPADLGCDPIAMQLENQVWIIAGGERIRLTWDWPVAANPALSPDGRRVAFTAGPEDDLDLYVMDIDGTGTRLVWADETSQSAVAWSPGGASLVFDQIAADGTLQVFATALDGGNPTQLTEGAPNGKPKTAGDGDIVFLSLRDGEDQEIYTMDPNGAGQHNLTEHPSRDVLADVSPDGSRIVFASDRSGNWDLWLMDRDGTNQTQLTSHPERDTNPTWTPDGSHVIFRSDRTPAGLWSVPVGGGEPQALVVGGWLADCPAGAITR